MYVLSLACLLAFSLATSTLAQTTLTGTVRDGTGKPLAFANVLLLAAKDSALVKGMVADETGWYQQDNVPKGEYLVQASMVGYRKVYSALFTLSGNSSMALTALILPPESQQLSEVKVVAPKPLYEQQMDRLVVNLQNSITSAGSTALEVLQRSPGVTVNPQSGVMSLNGKEGVGVMINGKLSRMSASALMDMLGGMNAANLEKIELIANPPARYDAEGTGGLINLVLKQHPDYGTNGSLALTAGYGYGIKTGASLTLNHRTRRLTLFGDYSYSLNQRRQWIDLWRSFIANGLPGYSRTVGDRRPVVTNHTARLGFDYLIGRKTTLGGQLSGYSNKWEVEAQNRSVIINPGRPEQQVTIDNLELNHWRHLMGNLNVTQTFRPGQELRIDLDYLRYHDNNPTDYLNRSVVESGLPQEFQLNNQTPIRMGVYKLDYRQPLGTKVTWEAGMKGYFSHFSNRVTSSYLDGSTWVTDPVNTRSHVLSERISAAYTSWQVQVNAKTKFLAGLRYEHTRTLLTSDTDKEIVNRRYGNLFPNVQVSHTFSKNSSGQLSYGRRITRPAFNDLMPFLLLLGPGNFITGNPALQPALSQTVKVQYQFKNLIASLQYNHETSSIANQQPHFNADRQEYVFSAENLKQANTLTVMAILPWQVTTWWTMQNTGTATHQQLTADYLLSPIQVTAFSFRFNTTQRFQLPRAFALELSGYYQSPALVGVYRLKALGEVNLGLQKKLKNQGGMVSLTWQDLFWTTLFRRTITLPENDLEARLTFIVSEPRIVKVTYTRQFGNQKLTTRTRATGSEEDRKRVNQPN